MGSFLKDCACAKPTRCPHPYTLRFRDVLGKHSIGKHTAWKGTAPYAGRRQDALLSRFGSEEQQPLCARGSPVQHAARAGLVFGVVLPVAECGESELLARPTEQSDVPAASPGRTAPAHHAREHRSGSATERRPSAAVAFTAADGPA